MSETLWEHFGVFALTSNSVQNAYQPGLTDSYVRPWSGKEDNREGVPPYPVATYIEGTETKDTLDAKRFGVISMMRLRRTAGGLSVDRAEAWRKRWKHLSNKPKTFPLDGDVDIRWARSQDDFTYAQTVLSSLETLPTASNAEIKDFPVFLTRIAHYFMFGKEKKWMSERAFEQRWRVRTMQGENSALTPPKKLFVSFHNTEVNHIPYKTREQLYVPVPDWWQAYEPCILMNLPSPPFLVYFSGMYFKGSGEEQQRLLKAACVESCVMTLHCFLDSARNGIPFHVTSDPRLGRAPGGGVLLPIPEATRQVLNGLGIVGLLKKLCSDPVGALVAFELSGAIDWRHIRSQCPRQGECEPWLGYNWDQGSAEEVPTATGVAPIVSRSRRGPSGFEVTGTENFHMPRYSPVFRPGRTALTRAEATMMIDS